MNPYWGKTFFETLFLFFQRLPLLMTGKATMASDELQIFILLSLGLSSAIVGVFLVLKKAAMQANALSHTVLVGIAVLVIFSGQLSFTLTSMLLAGVLSALLTVGLTYFAHNKLGLQEDASIGLIFTFLFALGVLLITLYTRNLHIGAEAIMGNLDASHRDDLKLLLATLVLNIFITFILYQRYKMLCFDPVFSKVVSKISYYEVVLILQTTMTIMAGFRAVGVILVLSLITGPSLIARLFTARLPMIIALSCLISFLGSLFSVALSRHILSTLEVPVSTSSLLPLFLLLLFLASATVVRKVRI
jgi:manganese/zinc/iron transport system permease protein